MTIPLGIASHFQRPARERPAVLLLDADGPDAPDAAVDLATALAGEGHRIVLCDLSLVAPALHRVLGVPNDEGMTDLFTFGASLRRVTTSVRDGALFFAPAGVGVPDPERIAAHPRWDRLLAGATEANATLLLFAPVDLPGVHRIASRVGYAAVLGSVRDAEIAAARLPGDCALLDRIPTADAHTARDAREAESADTAADADTGEDTAVDPVAAAVEAAGEDLAGFSPFDDDTGRQPDVGDAPSGSPAAVRRDAPASAITAPPADAAPRPAAATAGESAAAVTDPPSRVDPDPPVPEVVPATPLPDSSAATTAADPAPAVSPSSEPSTIEPPEPDADAAGLDAEPSEPDAEVRAEGIGTERTARAPRDEEAPEWSNRISLAAVVALLVVLLIALIWIATIFLSPDADAGAEAVPGGESLVEAPMVANGAIPAVPEGGEVVPLGFTVAIEAHEDLPTARERLARLNRVEDDMPFLITPYLLDGVVYYRVMAGPYADSAEAVVVRDILYQDGRKPTVGEWDVRPTAFGFLLDELDSPEAARSRAEELIEAGIPTYPVSIAPDGATRLYAGAFELREQSPVLDGPLANAGLDPALVRISGWVAER